MALKSKVEVTEQQSKKKKGKQKEEKTTYLGKSRSSRPIRSGFSLCHMNGMRPSDPPIYKRFACKPLTRSLGCNVPCFKGSATSRLCKVVGSRS